MKWTTYSILILFGAFVLLLILNPNMSCFGKRIRSPLYPLLRKKKAKRSAAGQAEPKTEDYGFRLD